jgi:hypothetical protein
LYQYLCEVCGRSFVSEQGVFVHRTKIHRPSIKLPVRFTAADLENLLQMIAIAKEWIADGRISDSEVREMQDGRDDPEIDSPAGDSRLPDLWSRRPSRIRQLIQQYSDDRNVID